MKNVSNSESRLGVKGQYEIDDNMTAMYKAEIGLDSTYKDGENSSTSGRIRIRLLEASLKGSPGTLTIGQTYTPSSKMVLGYDPLSDTSVGFHALTQKLIVVNINSAMGALYRSRRDLIKYASPRYMGANIQLSIDRNDQSGIDPTVAGMGKTFYEALINYQQRMGDSDFTFDLGYITWEGKGKGLITADTKNESSLFAGFKFHHSSGAGINLIYNPTEFTKTGTTDDIYKQSRMGLGIQYKMDKHLFALTYAIDSEEQEGRDGDATSLSDADKFSNSQMAFGYKHNCNEKVQLKASLGILERKEESSDPTLTANNNQATLIGAGIQIKF